MKRTARLYAPTSARPMWCAELCICQGWRNRQVQRREWFGSKDEAVTAMKVWCHHSKDNLFPEGKRPCTEEPPATSSE